MKHKLRAEISAQVKALSPDYCRRADAGIIAAILDSPLYREASTIFAYAGTQREIQTMPLLEQILTDGKVLALPLCTPAPGIMEARQIRRLEDLAAGKYGILAPKEDCPLIPPAALTLALVPCCSGNRRGQRLGYGGGYYDRFLPQTCCPKLLLCREQLTRDPIPTDPHDLTMDYLVTENGIFPCNEGESPAATAAGRPL